MQSQTKVKAQKAAQHTNISEKDILRFILADLAENSKFLWECIKIDNLWKSILHNLRHLFKAFQWSDDQIPKLYNTNDRLNVIELLTTIRTSTKQTKNTSKIIDLRGRLKTADHCGAVLLFELNSLTYAFCSTSQEILLTTSSTLHAWQFCHFCSTSHYSLSWTA